MTEMRLVNVMIKPDSMIIRIMFRSREFPRRDEWPAERVVLDRYTYWDFSRSTRHIRTTIKTEKAVS